MKIHFNYFDRYIFRFRVIIYFILSGLLFITYGTEHYVDKTATGSNNGTSWSNAWTSFSAINWSSIQPGDIVYISGGIDSTVYNGSISIGKSGASGNLITIRNGLDAGHNGKVIIDGVNRSYNGFNINGDNFLKISGLYMRNLDEGFHIGTSASYIYIDSIDFRSGNNGVYIFGQSSNYNFTVHHLYVSNSTFATYNPTSVQTDVIYIQWAKDIFIDNCNLLQLNAQPGPHADNIQFQYGGNITVSNNYMYNIQSASSQGLIFQFHPGGYTQTIYNNILYMPNVTASSGIQIGYQWTGTTNVILYGNTLVCPNNNQTLGIYSTAPINLTMKNNILVSAPSQTCVAYSGSLPSDLDYNIYYGASAWGGYSVSALQSMGRETHGYSSNPNFVGMNGYGNFHINSPSNAIDNGVTLSNPYNVDKDGMTRPQGSSFDIGAYELEQGGGGGNNPPNQPTNPSPINGAINQPINLMLTWNCSDPNGDSLTYDVYFGNTINPPLISGNQSGTTFNPGQLNNNITYYWKIVAKDNQNASTSGPIWNFSTITAGGSDVIPPELVGVQIVESNKVVLDFSEPLDTVPLLNLLDYSISNQIEVTGVEIYPSHQRVCLNTTNHDTDFVYSITVSNLKDTSGNIITSQHNSAFYKLLNIAPVSYSEYLVDEVEASSTSDTTTSPVKTLDGLGMGDPDPNSRWASEFMPQWIQFDLGTTKPIIMIASSFYRWDQGRIYQYSIQISDNSIQWNEIVSNASSSNQEWTLNEFSSLEARYVRIICLGNNEADWAGLWETHIFGPDSITPVEFNSFTAKANNGDVLLSWITATEKNNHLFLIERAKGDNEFTVIGSVPGNGTSIDPHSYSFTDKSVSTGSYSYRIEQLDYSGEFSYSNTINLEVIWPTEFVLEQNYPNPFNPTTTIRYYVPHNSIVKLTLFNAIGEEVALLVNEEKQIGVYNVELNAKDMSSGVYFYRLQSGNFVMTKKMILMK